MDSFLSNSLKDNAIVPFISLHLHKLNFVFLYWLDFLLLPISLLENEWKFLLILVRKRIWNMGQVQCLITFYQWLMVLWPAFTDFIFISLTILSSMILFGFKSFKKSFSEYPEGKSALKYSIWLQIKLSRNWRSFEWRFCLSFGFEKTILNRIVLKSWLKIGPTSRSLNRFFGMFCFF